ncbi:MAG: metallophosphoesterase family protein [Dehalococcoidales bacterium]|nr:metallophosphoesterase family protein [Dehalococcoidales bacterium]
MRIAITADIHANLAALEAVLDDMEKIGDISSVICLGDIVGYGPDPHECVELIRHIDCLCVAGNHDFGAVGKLNPAVFTADAAEVIRWTAGQLNAADIAFLGSLPETAAFETFTLVHGSPRNPFREYVSSISIARENFACFENHCLFGHSHLPQIYQTENGECLMTVFSENRKLVVGETRLMINPGAVGQPRDGDPRASWAVYDTETRIMQLRRVPYAVRKTQDKMMKSGLPIRLIGRLDVGN